MSVTVITSRFTGGSRSVVVHDYDLVRGRWTKREVGLFPIDGEIKTVYCHKLRSTLVINFTASNWAESYYVVSDTTITKVTGVRIHKGFAQASALVDDRVRTDETVPSTASYSFVTRTVVKIGSSPTPHINVRWIEHLVKITDSSAPALEGTYLPKGSPLGYHHGRISRHYEQCRAVVYNPDSLYVMDLNPETKKYEPTQLPILSPIIPAARRLQATADWLPTTATAALFIDRQTFVTCLPLGIVTGDLTVGMARMRLWEFPHEEFRASSFRPMSDETRAMITGEISSGTTLIPVLATLIVDYIDLDPRAITKIF